jgi:transposase InsO family protein
VERLAAYGEPVEGTPFGRYRLIELLRRGLGWVHWHNTSRLHGYLKDLPPAEFEATFYATKRTDLPLVEIQ